MHNIKIRENINGCKNELTKVRICLVGHDYYFLLNNIYLSFFW